MRDEKLWLAMPASLGEICQGYYRGSEKLASYAIDLYNEMRFAAGPPSRRGAADRKFCPVKNTEISYYRSLPSAGPVAAALPPKLRSLAALICSRLEAELPQQLSIIHISRIPLGRGLGSSTADLALLARGLYRLAGKNIEKDDMARLLPRIEPTDSTFFPAITIYEQNAGKSWQELGNMEADLEVLQLGRPGSCDTIKSRSGRRKPPGLQKAFSLLKEALQQQNPELLGRAASISALSWQDRLDYPGLEKIMALAESCGCLGVNIAHSGSVIGIIHSRSEADIEGFKAELDSTALTAHYPFRAGYRIVSGGLRELKPEQKKVMRS